MENRRSQIRCFTFSFRPPSTTEEEPNRCDGCSECDGPDDRSTTSSLPEQRRSTEKENPGERKNCHAGNHCLVCDKPLPEVDASDNDITMKKTPQNTGNEENIPLVQEICYESKCKFDGCSMAP